MKRYIVTVKENGDTFWSVNKLKVLRWMQGYQDATLNQDEPWKPSFNIKEEEIS